MKGFKPKNPTSNIQNPKLKDIKMVVNTFQSLKKIDLI